VNVDGGATGQYAYDPSNRRYKKVTGGATTHYIWQGSHVVAEYDGSSGAVTVEYVYSGSRLIAKVSSGATQYFLSDRLSIRLMLDWSGNVLGRQGHLPFGEDFAESGTEEKIHFTTYERDGEIASDYSVNREYSSAVGGFNRPDPFRSSAKIADAQSFNRYCYVANDPVNRADPIGLLGDCPPPCHAVNGPNGGNCECPPLENPDLPDWGNTTVKITIGLLPGDPPPGPEPRSCAASTSSSSSSSTTDQGFDKNAIDSAYVCGRPLKGIGGLLFEHEYLCVMDKQGRTDCVSFGPSGSPWGSDGRNIPEDGYSKKKCNKLDGDSSFAQCVYEGMHKPLPYYNAGPGKGTICWTWTSDIIETCKKKSKT
jgi:RHS repeat-associated protein